MGRKKCNRVKRGDNRLPGELFVPHARTPNGSTYLAGCRPSRWYHKIISPSIGPAPRLGARRSCISWLCCGYSLCVVVLVVVVEVVVAEALDAVVAGDAVAVIL